MGIKSTISCATNNNGCEPRTVLMSAQKKDNETPFRVFRIGHQTKVHSIMYLNNSDLSVTNLFRNI